MLAPGLTGRLLPEHPHRLPDELFTSWLVRTARANGFKSQSFADLLCGKQSSFWARDQDKLAHLETLQKFGDITGKSFDEVYASTLRSYEGVLYEQHNAHGNTKWILPLGIYHRTWRKGGLQFCPLCLAEDTIPYFRRRWRLAMYTVCDKHGTLMHDRCPKCGAPVMFFRQELGRRSSMLPCISTQCSVCGEDLSRSPVWAPPAPDWQALVTLRAFNTFVDMGWWFHEQLTFPCSLAWLDVVHHLVTWLTSQAGCRALGRVEQTIGWRRPDASPYSRLPFEHRPLRDRHWLLMTSLWLLHDWPDRFRRVCNAPGLSQARIIRGERLPYWFESEVKVSLGREPYNPTEEEVRNAAKHLQDKSVMVSGNAVAMVVGSKDCQAVQPYKHQPSRRFTPDQCLELISVLNARIASLDKGSPRRLLLERDRVIFRLIVLTGWTLPRVMALTVSASMQLTKATSTSVLGSHDRHRLAGLLHTYFKNVRRALVGSTASKMLLVGWGGASVNEKGFYQKALYRRTTAQRKPYAESHMDVKVIPS